MAVDQRARAGHVQKSSRVPVALSITPILVVYSRGLLSMWGIFNPGETDYSSPDGGALLV